MLGGITDEITGAAGDAYSVTAGAADHMAGSTDEAVARTTDSTAGGGVIDGTSETLGGIYDGIAGGADHVAGSTDEAFARGELYDGLAGWSDHMAGSTDEWVGSNSGLLSGVAVAAVGLVALYLLQPILKVGAEVAQG